MYMARVARMKFDQTVGWYHLYASVAAVSGDYPLGEAVVRHKLIGVLRWYAHAYCCQVAAFMVMAITIIWLCALIPAGSWEKKNSWCERCDFIPARERF